MDLVMKAGYMRTKDGRLWHRVVCREAHGKIPKGWVVHHIDGCRLNNASENLIALPESVHNSIHARADNRQQLPKREQIEQILHNLERPKREKKPKVKRAPGHRIRKNERRAASLADANLVREFCAANPDKVRLIT